MNTELQAQIQATNELSFPQLGYFTWWNISKANISHDELEQWFKSNNVNPDLLINVPTYENTFNKACSKFNRQKMNDQIYLIRPVLKDENRVVVAVIKEDEVGENLEHRQEFKITLDRNSGAFISERPDDPISKEICNQYMSNKSMHDSMDVCKQILNMLNEANALHVRDHGGIYFVLSESKATVDKIEALVKEYDFGNFYALPQLDIAKVREAVSEAFLDNTASDIKGFQKAIEEWGNKKPHAKSLEAKAEEIEVTKEKIKTYARVLKLDVSSFETPINSIQMGIKELSKRKIKIQ